MSPILSSEEKRAQHRVYQLAWAKKNPERVRKYHRQWEINNPEALRRYSERRKLCRRNLVIFMRGYPAPQRGGSRPGSGNKEFTLRRGMGAVEWAYKVKRIVRVAEAGCPARYRMAVLLKQKVAVRKMLETERTDRASNLCARLADQALASIKEGDKDSLFLDADLVEGFIGRPCPRLRKVAERHGGKE